MAALLTACSPVARPVGDFGRAAPSWTHDTAMPVAGNVLASMRKEPVSDFNKTDQEEEMHDRVWRFLVAAHAKDWLFDSSVELQRTRIIPPGKDEHYRKDRYYDWLKRTEYASSRTRYSTVGRHIAADIDTLPTTFAAICAVIEVDRQRAVAYAGLGGGLPAATAGNLQARKYENDAFIAWFVRALNYRYDSYDYALDNLLVETPHEQSLAVNNGLQVLGTFVARANRADFCGDGSRHLTGGGVIIPSRYQRSGDTEVVLPK
ncbi:hypothetical protein SAMN05428969_0846 [Devosia sp. YR412]|nr:hypothetical protein SAMN05428969_0846 [Devosia sp. YR412]